MSEEMSKFDEAKPFEDLPGMEFPMQDKITTKLTAKGEIQAEVRIGGVLTTIKDIDDLVGQHVYAWAKLKIMFPNLVKPKVEENKK